MVGFIVPEAFKASTWNWGDAREDASPTQPRPSVPRGTSAISHADHSSPCRQQPSVSAASPRGHLGEIDAQANHPDVCRRRRRPARPATVWLGLAPNGRASDLHRPHRCSHCTPTRPCEHRRDVPARDRSWSGAVEESLRRRPGWRSAPRPAFSRSVVIANGAPRPPDHGPGHRRPSPAR